MNLYETTFILNPQADDATLDRQVKAISDLISSNGGKVVHEDRMGTRRLAYEIQGLTQGYYTSVYFEGAGDLPKVLDRHYRLEEPYIRHLTLVFEGDIEQVKEARGERIPPEFGGRPVARDGESGSGSGDRPTPESTPIAEKSESAVRPEPRRESAESNDATAPIEITEEESPAAPESDDERSRPEPEKPAADDTYSDDDEL